MVDAAFFSGASIGYEYVVVDGLTLRIPRPSLTTILGPNGSGKTTVLRALIKMSRLFHGSIYIDGIDTTRLRIEDLPKHVSYSPAELGDSMFMTVLDMVSNARGVNGWVDVKRAMGALDYLGIKDLAYKRFNELSTGQKRLVMIARAIASGANTLILDEPTSNLDLGNKYRVINILKRLVADLRVTVITATHDIDLALVSDLVVALKDGKLLAAGGPDAVIRDDVLTELYGVKVSVVELNGKKVVYVLNY